MLKIKHVSFFTICTKPLVTIAFTFTIPDEIVVLDLNKNIGGSTDLAKKRHGSADLHTPIPPRPSLPLPKLLHVYTQVTQAHCLCHIKDIQGEG